MLPDWVPPLHLLAVYAPVVLYLAALLTDLFAIAIQRWAWGGTAATGLFVAAGLAAVVAYYTGAATSVLAWYAMLYGALYGLLRLGLSLGTGRGVGTALRVGVFVVALGGVYVMAGAAASRTEAYAQGEREAGRQAARQALAVDTTAAGDGAVPDSLLGFSSWDGGWHWVPDSPGAWKDRVDWVEGGPPSVRAYLFEPEGTGQQGLSLTLASGPVLFVFPPALGPVAVDAEINLDDFEGTVRLAHHVRGPRYYDFVEVGGAAVRLGRVEGQSQETFDRREADLTGWRTVRAVGDGTTFRAYVGDAMVADGSGNPAGAGRVGLYLAGRGTVRLRSLRAEAIEDGDADGEARAAASGPS